MSDRNRFDVIPMFRSPAPRRRLRLLLLLFMLPCVALAAPTQPAEVIDPAVVAALANRMSQQLDKGDSFDEKVWLQTSKPKLARYVTLEKEQDLILERVYLEAAYHGVDPDLLLALMQIESRFDRFAVSSAGAQGLMQVMPFWRNEIGRPQDNLTEIETNISYGTAILAQYLVESRGDLTDALTRYNGSRGRLNYPNLVIGAYTSRWQKMRTNDELPQLQAACKAYPLMACQSVKSAQRWYQ